MPNIWTMYHLLTDMYKLCIHVHLPCMAGIKQNSYFRYSIYKYIIILTCVGGSEGYCNLLFYLCVWTKFLDRLTTLGLQLSLVILVSQSHLWRGFCTVDTFILIFFNNYRSSLRTQHSDLMVSSYTQLLLLEVQDSMNYGRLVDIGAILLPFLLILLLVS